MNTRKKKFFFPGRGEAPVPGFDPLYEEILDRADFEGFDLPSAPVQQLQNDLLVALKPKLLRDDRFLNYMHDGSAQFSTINWADPSAPLATLVSSPIFTALEGFTGNGTSAYIDSNFTPGGSSHYNLNDAHVMLYVRQNTASGNHGRILGDVNTLIRMRVNSIADQRINNPSTGEAMGWSGTPTGLFSQHRTSSQGGVAYLGGEIERTWEVPSTALPTSSIHVLRSNVSYSTNQVSFFSAGDAQADIIGDVSHAIDDYVNAIGAL